MLCLMAAAIASIAVDAGVQQQLLCGVVAVEVEAVEDAVLGEPDCILINPVTVDGEKWPQYSDDTEVALRSSDIIVMVNTSKEVSKKKKNLIE